MSLRLRLTLWYAAVLSAALALFGGLLFFSMRERMLSEIDRELEGTSSRFQTYFTAESTSEYRGHLRSELVEFCQALPPTFSINLQGSNGFAFHHPQDARISDARTVRRTFEVVGNNFNLETATSLTETLHTLRLLRVLLLSLSPIVIFVACVGGAWMSRRALKPVDDIAASALTIGIENLSRRLPVPATKDEIARLSEVLNLMFARLESAVKTLSRFVADASHELRTPLAVIRATAEVTLRRERSPEAYRNALEEIVAESERMTGLVEDLLTLARNDTQAAEMPLASIDANRIVRQVCAEMESLGELRQIDLKAGYSDSPAIISANEAALHRLFLVLLDNAFKYSHPGGQVRVTVANADGRVRVAIEDSGVGIADQIFPHIFKRFYRGDPSRTGAGHGLGLSLAQSIALAHGATIEVESVPGKGSRFEVLFPLKPASGNLQIPSIPSTFAGSVADPGERSKPK